MCWCVSCGAWGNKNAFLFKMTACIYFSLKHCRETRSVCLCIYGNMRIYISPEVPKGISKLIEHSWSAGQGLASSDFRSALKANDMNMSLPLSLLIRLGS